MTTAVSPVLTPILQFFDNVGRPCSGGTVLTQIGGINAATYQDSAGAIPLPNPIPLNSRGEISNASGVSCQLFLETGRVYVFTLFDVAGNQLNQAVYCVGADSAAAALATQLADTSNVALGDAMIGDKESYSGSLATTQHLVNASAINVWRWLTAAQIADVKARTRTLDLSTNLASAIADAKANNIALIYPPGDYRSSLPMLIDWSHARVSFIGKVVFYYTGATAYAVAIDGGASTTEIGDVQFGRGGGPIIEAPNATAALLSRAANRSHIEFSCAAAITTALQVNFAVCTDFKIICSSNIPDTVAMPVNGMKLNARGAAELVSACKFEHIIEGVTGDGVVSTAAQHCRFHGTSEGNGGRGYAESGSSQWNTFDQTDNEANTGADYSLGGYASIAHGALSAGSTTATVISGSRNVLSGAVFNKLTINSTAVSTVLDNASCYDGQLTDNGIGTVYRNAYHNTALGNADIPDVARKSKLKLLGALTIFQVTKAATAVINGVTITPVVMIIADNGLDYGDSIAIAGLSLMTQLNGHTYQVEPIPNSNSFYLLSGGTYVDGTGWTDDPNPTTGTAKYCDFTNSWTNVGASFRAFAGFTKDASGDVTLFGTLKSGASGNSMFTLPAGFRPLADYPFSTPNMQVPGEMASITVANDGRVVPIFATAANCKISLHGVRFRAEA